MNELLTRLCKTLAAGHSVALASVIAQRGSTPRGVGSHLVADAEGRLLAGTIGGGLAEAHTLTACRAALQSGQSTLVDFAMDGTIAAQSDMICGGHLRILVEPLSPTTATLHMFQTLLHSLHNNGATLLTDISNATHPTRYVITHNTSAAHTTSLFLTSHVPADLVALLPATLPTENNTSLVEHNKKTVVIEHCLPPWRLILAGGGHVSRPTAQIASIAGFDVAVLDDRAEFVLPERFPWASICRVTPDYADCFALLTITPRTCIIIVTRGHLHDASVLQQALETNAGYIGMIGSIRKKEDVYATLRTHGVATTLLNKVYCPVGLPIKAETPEEIAVSIVAQCIAHRRNA